MSIKKKIRKSKLLFKTYNNNNNGMLLNSYAAADYILGGWLLWKQVATVTDGSQPAGILSRNVGICVTNLAPWLVPNHKLLSPVEKKKKKLL